MLRRAIRSVLNQTYPHFHVCVYDNASGDETASVVAEIMQTDSRVHYHLHPENIGAIPNFTYGMERVNTPFFSFLSDDDILLPEFYKTALEGFQQCPEAVLSATADLSIDDGKKIHGSNILFYWKAGVYHPPDGLLAMLKNDHPNWIGILFQTDIIKRLGPLDLAAGMIADLDFELRAAGRFSIVVSVKPGAILMIHSSSSSLSVGFSSRWEGWRKMIQNIAEDNHIAPHARATATDVLEQRLQKSLLSEGIRSVVRKRFEDALQCAEILRNHYNLKWQAFCLKAIAMACRRFSLLYRVALLLATMRSHILRYNAGKKLHKHLGDYKYLLKHIE